MNVCALDVVARTPDFESVAASIELRGWEWDLLHGADGESTLGDIARTIGIDTESAIGFVHEALHRGLLGVGTMSLQSYRARLPTQAALSGSPAPLSLGPAAVAAPVEEPTAETHGAISFSSDAFDWSEPEASFDDAEADVPSAQTPAPAPGKTITAHVGGVHYDERFGVEHPDGPFAAATTTTEAEPDATSAHEVEDPFAAATESEPFVEAAPHDEPIVAQTRDDVANAASAHVDDPFAPKHEAEPFVATAQHDEPAAAAPREADPFSFEHVDDPFSVRAPEPQPAATSHGSIAFDVSHFGEVSHFDEPTSHKSDVAETVAAAPVATEIGNDRGFASEAVASTNGHATTAEEPVEDSAPGSISFSFSQDDPIDSQEVTYEAPASTRMAQAPKAESPIDTIEHHEPVVAQAPAPVTASAPAPAPAESSQSTYFERAAIDTDASREFDEKSKNWKDSLSWREQQEINAAIETGKEKQGVIGTLLRALGVR